MKTIQVTDKVARLIDRIQDDGGYNEEMAFIGSGHASASTLIEQTEAYDAESFRCMSVMNAYKALIDELAMSKEIQKGGRI